MGNKSHISTGKFQILIGLLAAILLVGCRPKGILHSWEMRKVMVDLHKTDAILQLSGFSTGHEEEKDLYYAQVLEKHGVTQAQFDSSLVWYTAHPLLFDKIYPRVLAQLEAEEEAFKEEHEEELAQYQPDKPSSADKPIKTFTKAQADSILWVTQHGYPTLWNPLVHNFENQFFPQIGVLR